MARENQIYAPWLEAEFFKHPELLRGVSYMKLLALIVILVLVVLLVYFFGYVKTKEKRLIVQGILPKPEDTTIEDIKRLKRQDKYSEWALIRLMQMSEYRDKPHEELKDILDDL